MASATSPPSPSTPRSRRERSPFQRSLATTTPKSLAETLQKARRLQSFVSFVHESEQELKSRTKRRTETASNKVVHDQDSSSIDGLDESV
ncbi:unnamed protein product [Malus baccata var. baccata]